MLLQQARSAEAFLDSPAPPNRWVTPAFFSVWRIAFILLIVPAGVFAWRLIKLASGD